MNRLVSGLNNFVIVRYSELQYVVLCRIIVKNTIMGWKNLWENILQRNNRF